MILRHVDFAQLMFNTIEHCNDNRVPLLNTDIDADANFYNSIKLCSIVYMSNCPWKNLHQLLTGMVVQLCSWTVEAYFTKCLIYNCYWVRLRALTLSHRNMAGFCDWAYNFNSRLQFYPYDTSTAIPMFYCTSENVCNICFSDSINDY